MSEYEILDLYFVAQNQVMTFLQWWVGVTFGLLVVGHVGTRKLNAFLLASLALLYASFSFVTYGFFIEKSDSMRGYLGDLNALQQAGQSLSPSTVEFVESGLAPIPWFANLVFVFAFGGTFVATMGYVVYTYLKGRRRPLSEPANAE